MPITDSKLQKEMLTISSTYMSEVHTARNFDRGQSEQGPFFSEEQWTWKDSESLLRRP